MRRFLSIFSIISALFFGVTIFASAQGLSSQVLSLSIINPDGPMSNVRVLFDIPQGFVPGGLSDLVIWDSVNRKLAVYLGSFAPGEVKPVNVTLTAPPGAYTITGKATGLWDSAAKPFSSDIKPITLVFQPPISSLSSAEKQIAAIPEEQRKGTILEDLAGQLASNKQLIKTAETISLPIAVGLGAVSVVSLLTSAYAASASFAAAISRIVSYIGFGLFRLKRRKPWGRVVDHLTGKPIQGVSVKIIDTAFKKVKETQITDVEGRFGFLVSPGEYFIRVSKNGFGEKETGGFRIVSYDQVLNFEISLEPLKVSLAEYALRAVRFWHRLNNFLAKINPLILVVGAAFSVISTLLTPSLVNYIVLGGYGLLFVLNIVLALVFVRSYGRVLDRSGDAPLALAVVRLFSSKENWLLGTRVTDQLGRFEFLINPGEYYVTVAKDPYKGYQSRTSYFSKATILNYDIKLDR